MILNFNFSYTGGKQTEQVERAILHHYGEFVLSVIDALDWPGSAPVPILLDLILGEEKDGDTVSIIIPDCFDDGSPSLATRLFEVEDFVLSDLTGVKVYLGEDDFLKAMVDLDTPTDQSE